MMQISIVNLHNFLCPNSHVMAHVYSMIYSNINSIPWSLADVIILPSILLLDILIYSYPKFNKDGGPSSYSHQNQSL